MPAAYPQITNANDDSMTLNFDKGNRLARIVDANSRLTQFGYNTQSRLQRITGCGHHTTALSRSVTQPTAIPTYDTTFEYDARQRLTTTTSMPNQTSIRRVGVMMRASPGDRGCKSADAKHL